MSTTHTVLITGANRGLGLGLTTRYLAQPSTTVIAGVRDVAKSSQALQDLPKGKDSRIIIVKIDSTSPTDALDAVKEIEKQGIRHLDLVIANAGVANTYPTVKDLKIEDLQAHLEPNVFGPIRLYQATIALLAKASEPKWVTIGSMAGQISDIYPIPNAAYSPSKIAVHWITKKIDPEEEVLCAFIIHPGFVSTDMGNFGANHFGMEGGPPTSVDESCDGMVKLIGEATKGSHGGKLFQFTGEQMPW